MPYSSQGKRNIEQTSTKNSRNSYRSISTTNKTWCYKRGANTLQADEIIVLQFLTEEYQRSLSVNYLSSYISALRNYLLNTVLNPYVTQKFMKGMAKLKPPKIKYHAIWDVQILLEFFENISLDNYMDVSRKLFCLFVVLSASRTTY